MEQNKDSWFDQDQILIKYAIGPRKQSSIGHIYNHYNTHKQTSKESTPKN